MISQFRRSESNQREAENPLVTGRPVVFTKRALRQANRNEPSTVSLVCGRASKAQCPRVGRTDHVGGDHRGVPHLSGTVYAGLESGLAGLRRIASFCV